MEPTAGIEPTIRPYQGRGFPLTYAGLSLDRSNEDWWTRLELNQRHLCVGQVFCR